MSQLPDNTKLSLDYCNRWCGILVIDGKHVKVKYPYQQKIPWIWGMDYLSHDLPVGILVPAESQEAFAKYFRLLKTINYPLQIVVCDDILSALIPGLKRYYPKAKIQLCHTHYLENIRKKLKYRTEQRYRHFFNSLRKHVFIDAKNDNERNIGFYHIFTERTNNNLLLQQIVIDTYKLKQYLFAYEQIKHCPNSTNILECYNSHLQGRLKTIKGFQTYEQANLWLNAYIIRRRVKKYTDCNIPFKYLNGYCSLQKTLKRNVPWPDIYGIQEP